MIKLNTDLGNNYSEISEQIQDNTDYNQRTKNTDGLTTSSLPCAILDFSVLAIKRKVNEWIGLRVKECLCQVGGCEEPKYNNLLG